MERPEHQSFAMELRCQGSRSFFLWGKDAIKIILSISKFSCSKNNLTQSVCDSIMWAGEVF